MIVAEQDPPAQQVQLPSAINPCPIIDVACEWRFTTELPPQAIAGVVYAAVREEFPKMLTLPTASIPPEAQALDPNLRFQAHYRLEGDRGVLLVGPQAVVFGLGSGRPYPGWVNLRGEFQSVFTRLAAANFVTGVQRFGLRYINFFPGNVLPKLALSFILNGRAATVEGTSFRTVLPAEGCKLLLQIATGAALMSDPKETGTILDIDAFSDNPLREPDLTTAFMQFLDVAHSAEKGLFFRLLKSELLWTLNPVYQPLHA